MPRIPISADPASALQALNKIKKSLDDLGQAGKKVSQIDLSMPTLGTAGKHAETIQRNFQELLRGHRALAEGIRKSGQQGVPVWDLDFERMYPSPEKAARARELTARCVTRGTPYFVAAPPSGSQQAVETGGAGTLVSGAMRYFKPLLALAGITGTASMAAKAISYGQDEATAVDPLRRSLNAVNEDFVVFRNRIRESSEGLMVSYREMGKLTQAYSRAAGIMGGEAAAGGARSAVGFGRAFGLDPSMAARLFGQGQFLQMGGPGGTRQMAAMFADAIAGSGMFAKADEIMATVLRYTETQERIAVKTPNVGSYISELAAMNAYGTEAGMPGLRGAAGAGILDRVNQAIMNGGAAGEASMNYIWRALGGGRSGLSPFRAKYLMEGGAFEQVGGRTILERFMGQLQADPNYRRPMVRYAAGSGALGLSMRQYEGLENVMRKYGGGSFSRVGAYMNQQGQSLSSMSETGIMGLANVLYAGENGNPTLDQLRSWYLADGAVSKSDKTRLRGAVDSEALRTALADIAARTGMQKTPGTETAQAVKDMENAMTASGSRLLGATNAIKDMTSGILSGVNSIVDYLLPEAERPAATINRRGARHGRSRDTGGDAEADFQDRRDSRHSSMTLIIKNERGNTLGTHQVEDGNSVSVPHPRDSR